MISLSSGKEKWKVRFGGPTLNHKVIKDENFVPETYLKGLNDKEFHFLFHVWLTQCWIYDSTELVPTKQEQLEAFNINSLIPEFKIKYCSGDWQKIVENSGASIDELFLFYQMLFRQTIVFMINKNQVHPAIPPEIAKYYLIEEDVIIPILLNYINYDPLCIVLVTDGIDYHILNPFFYDKEREMIQYQDNIGEKGTCFLSRENNFLKIDSRFIGHNKKGNWCWEISIIDFSRVFYGLTLLYNQLNLWNTLAYALGIEKIMKSSTNA